MVQQLFGRSPALGDALDRRGGQRLDNGVGMLGAAVGVQELTGHVNNCLAVPRHAQPPGAGDLRNLNRLKIFIRRRRNKPAGIRRAHNDRHAFLRFGNRKLGAVQPVVLARHGVQIDIQPVRQLADGNRYAARAEVIAAPDHAGNLRVPEQALELTLFGGVALLHLCAAGFQRFLGVALGGAGRAAAAVAPGAPAKQDDQVAGFRDLADNVARRGRADDRADLHALGDVARMVNLMHQPGRKADLVAVGRIARRRRLAQLALGQLVGQGLGERDGRVARAGYAHGLIDVGASG